MTVPESSSALGPVPAVWGNVPQRNKNFTGRLEILGQLRQGVSSAVTAVLPHALQGMGGVGKTAVAIEYAHMFRAEYELVWWIPADQPALVRSSLAALADLIGLESASAAGIETAASAVLNALRRGDPYSRWLLIFDNADQPEDINDIIPRGPGDVLITSRNHRWESVVDTVSVDVFSREREHRLPGQAGAAGNSTSPRLTGWPRNSVTCRWPWSRRAHCRPRPACRSTNTCGCSKSTRPRSWPKGGQRTIRGR